MENKLSSEKKRGFPNMSYTSDLKQPKTAAQSSSPPAAPFFFSTESKPLSESPFHSKSQYIPESELRHQQKQNYLPDEKKSNMTDHRHSGKIGDFSPRMLHTHSLNNTKRPPHSPPMYSKEEYRNVSNDVHKMKNSVISSLNGYKNAFRSNPNGHRNRYQKFNNFKNVHSQFAGYNSNNYNRYSYHMDTRKQFHSNKRGGRYFSFPKTDSTMFMREALEDPWNHLYANYPNVKFT